MADIPESTKSDSIYDIARNSPPFTWEERAAVDEADVEAALGASVPGGSSVLAWLPMADGHTIHQTARDVMRAAIAAVDKARSTRAAPPAMDREAEEKAFRQWWDNDRDPDAAFPDREAFAFGYQSALSARPSPIKIDHEEVRAALQRSYEGWSNIIEMGIIPPQHRNNARQIADQCHEALSTLSADEIRQGEGDSLPAGAKPLTFSSAVPKFPDDEATVPHGFEIWVHTTSPLMPTMEDAYSWAKQYIAAATPASHASDGGKA